MLSACCQFKVELGPHLSLELFSNHMQIMETTNRTYAFAALLQLLRNPPEEVKPDQVCLSDELVSNFNVGMLNIKHFVCFWEILFGYVQMPKFNDLVVKCLIKLTKSMQVGMEVRIYLAS